MPTTQIPDHITPLPELVEQVNRVYIYSKMQPPRTAQADLDAYGQYQASLLYHLRALQKLTNS